MPKPRTSVHSNTYKVRGEMEGVRVNIQDISTTKDLYGNEYITYEIDITVSSPFHGWHIYRRYTDFVNLYSYLTNKSSPRILPHHTIPLPSASSHLYSFLNPLMIASRRRSQLQSYLSALVQQKDLSDEEINILKVFLDYEQYETFLSRHRDRVQRRMTVSDVERSLLKIEQITQVSRVLFLEHDDGEAEAEGNQQTTDLLRAIEGPDEQQLPEEEGHGGGHNVKDLPRPSSSSSSSSISYADKLNHLISLAPHPSPSHGHGLSDREEQHRKRSGSCFSEELDPEQSAIWRTVPDPEEPPSPSPSSPSTPVAAPVPTRHSPSQRAAEVSGQEETAATTKRTPAPSPNPATTPPPPFFRSSQSLSTTSPSLTTPPSASASSSHRPPLATRSLSAVGSSPFTGSPGGGGDGLKEAIQTNDLRLMKQLLRLSPGLATAHCDSQGNPLLYTCALFNNLPIAFLLLDHGADPHTSNLNGLSALDIATPLWKTAIAERMQRRGGVGGEGGGEGLQYLTVSLQKTSAGIGLKLGKNPTGQAIIVGFTSPSKTRTPPPLRVVDGEGCETVGVVSAMEALRVCDLIHSIDGTEARDLGEVVKKVRECGVGEVLAITVKRRTGAGAAAGGSR
jgi:hypothetical protein